MDNSLAQDDLVTTDAVPETGVGQTRNVNQCGTADPNSFTDLVCDVTLNAGVGEGETSDVMLTRGPQSRPLISVDPRSHDVHSITVDGGGPVVKKRVRRSSKASVRQTESVDRRTCAAGEDGAALSGVILQIRELWRQRQDYQRTALSIEMRLGAICRRSCGGDKVAGAALLKRLLAGEDIGDVKLVAGKMLVCHQVLKDERKRYDQALVKMAKTLPVAPWCAGVRGVGISGTTLASLVGECGDIGSYKSVAALWKRLGVAVIEGVRQRCCVDPEKALLHSYSPHRRALLYTIAENLLRGQRTGDYYRDFYVGEKARQLAKGLKLGHAHRRAMRHMGKRFVRELYNAWRRATRRSEDGELSTQGSGVRERDRTTQTEG